jgi:hypothetical protein
MKRAAILLVLLAQAIQCAAQSVNDPCKLPPDLFDRRVAVMKEFESAVPGGDAVEEIRPRLKAVDQQYYQFMMALSDYAQQNRLAELKTCCAQNMHDPHARLTCRLALYLTKESTAKEFVERFPVSGNLDAFWALDTIACVKENPNSPSSIPALFRPDGPTSSYITELFRLVTKRDKPALQKYLQLSLRADGAIAEYMADQVEKLFFEHPDIVLDNWDALKNNILVTQNLYFLLPEDRKEQLRQKYERYCHINEGACREVIRALK